MSFPVNTTTLCRCTLLVIMLTLMAASSRAAGFDAGLSIEAVNATGAPGFDLGWGLEFGYEFQQAGAWNLGLQGHYLQGITDDEDVDEDIYWGDTDSEAMTFEAFSLGVTARPDRWPLLFKAGPVHIDYRNIREQDSGLGFAVGAAIVLGDDAFRLHLLDYEYYQIAGRGFNTLSFSFVFLAAL